ncbi:DnaJ domain-containing protein [Variovorax sp. GT1P44]|uniref:DnaJ domain-containing protein n=1 Tax=Variovorax sp. GT1P44 TaxID=3443742 RepID=UPI003F474FB4
MISAYVVLGIPGNATPEDVEAAYQRARSTYTRERMAEDARVAEQLNEVIDAHKVLSDPESRAAHDRKLARQVSAPSIRRHSDFQPVVEQESGTPRALVIIGLLVAALFAGGYFVQHRRQVAQEELAAKALETARQQAIAESESRRAAEVAAGERARADEAAQAKERAFRRESEMALSRAQSADAMKRTLDAQRFAAEQREEQRKEAERAADERRRISEGQRRVAIDKQRIRELCYINYRRYDC